MQQQLRMFMLALSGLLLLLGVSGAAGSPGSTSEVRQARRAFDQASTRMASRKILL